MALRAFNGGAMKYSEKLKDPRWQKKRLEVLERDGWCCQNCGDSESTLHVHHKYYERNKEPWEYPLDAFLTLCEQCHEWEYSERSGNEKDLLSMIKRAGFLAEDVHVLASAFHSIYLPYPPEVTASILNYVLSTPEIMRELSDKYFKSIKGDNGG